MTVEHEEEQKVSPMMAQWHECKSVAGNAILLFRMGDFYEAFYDDAILIANELELTLTKRQEIPMAGVPCHTCEGYIDKLVAKGFRVAVAEQTEDPKKTKGLVNREVVRVVTPGTIVNSSLLSDKTNNFFASITQVGSFFGLAVLDLTTAEFFIIEFDNTTDLLNELYRLRPAEVLTSRRFKSKNENLFAELKHAFSFLLNEHEDWHFEHQVTCTFLISHFNVHNLDGFGLKGMVAGINAGGALLQYLQDTLCLSLDHIRNVHTYSIAQYMSLDRTTQRNLELTEPLHEGSKQHTLFNVMDKTCTPMGARLLRHWVKQPLLCPAQIAERQDAVECFVKNRQALDQFSLLLIGVRDIERLIMKISSGYASPRDLVSLAASFQPMPQLRSLLQHIPQAPTFIQNELLHLDPMTEMVRLVQQAICDEPPARVSDGNIFRDGFHKELDELREISRNGKNWIARYQAHLRETTGIKTLKVGYNRMFGYYIEVSKGQADRMPDSFQRRQTLVNAERFISPELKDYESKVLTAEERIASVESELFASLRDDIAKFAPNILRVAQSIARLDSIHSLAALAVQYDYVRPVVDAGDALIIKDGRHPVIEAANSGEKFVPNDTALDQNANRLLLITGPNMAGKSTYIRQVALISIMAQIGSFVPAKEARIGVVDKVFTRIGASDDLSRGQSTFMVEMTETANILNNATSRSLVILDEIGRGTSTYDGISIAWAVAEFLLTAEGQQARTLFATHYWELTKLEEKVPGAVNYHVAVHESDDHVIFLRKIVRGDTDKSFGIHVARLAGLPRMVIGRANEILEHLEENANRKGVFEPSKAKAPPPKRKPKPANPGMQLSFFG